MNRTQVVCHWIVPYQRKLTRKVFLVMYFYESWLWSANMQRGQGQSLTSLAVYFETLREFLPEFQAVRDGNGNAKGRAGLLIARRSDDNLYSGDGAIKSAASCIPCPKQRDSSCIRTLSSSKSLFTKPGQESSDHRVERPTTVTLYPPFPFYDARLRCLATMSMHLIHAREANFKSPTTREQHKPAAVDSNTRAPRTWCRRRVSISAALFSAMTSALADSRRLEVSFASCSFSRRKSSRIFDLCSVSVRS